MMLARAAESAMFLSSSIADELAWSPDESSCRMSRMLFCIVTKLKQKPERGGGLDMSQGENLYR